MNLYTSAVVDGFRIDGPPASTPTLWIQNAGTETAVMSGIGNAGTWLTTSAIGDAVFANNNGSGNLLMGVGGVERLRIDGTTGNLGVGTTAPGQKLSVAGAIESTSGGFKFPDGTTQTTAVSGVNAFFQNGNSFGALAVLGTNDAQGLAFETGGVERVRVDPAGSVGIGTTAPLSTSRLHVEGAQANILLNDTSGPNIAYARVAQFSDDGGAYLSGNLRYDGVNWLRDDIAMSANMISTHGTAPLVVRYASSGANPATLTDLLRVEASGNVCINTSSPSARLHVLEDQLSVIAFRVDDEPGDASPFVIDSSGNVGIGTPAPNPTSAIHIAGIRPMIILDNTSTPETTYARFGGAGVTSSLSMNLWYDGTNWLRDDTAQAGHVIGMYGSAPLVLSYTPAGANPATLTDLLRVEANGNVGIGTASSSKLDVYYATASSNVDVFRILSNVGSAANPKFRIDTDGDVFTDGSTTIGTPADIAEVFPTRGARPEAGEVVRVVAGTADEIRKIREDMTAIAAGSPAHPAVFSNPVERAAGPYARDVVGIVSTDPGIKMSAALSGVPVALAGRVPVKVTLEGGPIRSGDLLTTSSTPGHAMKASEPWRGGIVGTALEEFGAGKPYPVQTGVIIALVHLNPAPSAQPGAIDELRAENDDLRSRLESLQRDMNVVKRMIGLSRTASDGPGAR
jgi:hypothetical protein